MLPGALSTSFLAPDPAEQHGHLPVPVPAPAPVPALLTPPPATNLGIFTIDVRMLR
jgi:hypothetical protein